MLSALKRLMGASTAGAAPEAQVLGQWAKAEGHAFKRVKDRQRGGHVVETAAGWRVEWGGSQRSYIPGQELRFRCDVGAPADAQLIMLSRVLAQTLEADVFSRYTHAMQTQIDNTLPEEMRWLAMHAKVSLAQSPALARRYTLLTNADELARRWLTDGLLQALESAATSWWTDTLVLVVTLNRGILTLRMSGQGLEPAQLRLVGQLFGLMAEHMRLAAQPQAD